MANPATTYKLKGDHYNPKSDRLSSISEILQNICRKDIIDRLETPLNVSIYEHCERTGSSGVIFMALRTSTKAKYCSINLALVAHNLNSAFEYLLTESIQICIWNSVTIK